MQVRDGYNRSFKALSSYFEALNIQMDQQDLRIERIEHTSSELYFHGIENQNMEYNPPCPGLFPDAWIQRASQPPADDDDDE